MDIIYLYGDWKDVAICRVLDLHVDNLSLVSCIPWDPTTSFYSLSLGSFDWSAMHLMGFSFVTKFLFWSSYFQYSIWFWFSSFWVLYVLEFFYLRLFSLEQFRIWIWIHVFPNFGKFLCIIFKLFILHWKSP